MGLKFDLVQILEGHVQLSFHLQQQQLIELIRENKIEEALDFAEAFLAPLGEEHPNLLKALGKLHAHLCCFDFILPEIASSLCLLKRQLGC